MTWLSCCAILPCDARVVKHGSCAACAPRTLRLRTQRIDTIIKEAGFENRPKPCRTRTTRRSKAAPQCVRAAATDTNAGRDRARGPDSARWPSPHEEAVVGCSPSWGAPNGERDNKEGAPSADAQRSQSALAASRSARRFVGQGWGHRLARDRKRRSDGGRVTALADQVGATTGQTRLRIAPTAV